MNIFDIIDGIAFSKKKELLQQDIELKYTPFMVNRWLSMLDSNAAKIINETVNKTYTVFNNPTDHYKFLLEVLSKYRKQRISYIKKNIES